MANLQLYLVSCALLLALSLRASTGLPVPTPSADSSAHCVSLFGSLLRNIKEVVGSEFMCHTSVTSVMVWNEDTVQACAPTPTQNPGCVALRNTSFSESECLSSIMKDLSHYDSAIRSYLKSPVHRPEVEDQLLRPTLRIIQSLKKDCSLTGNEASNSLEVDSANMWKGNSFTNRQKMCKMMRGFQVRAITMNRAVGYISSGDHRK